MSKIRVYFDFVCPYCYHAWGSLRKLQEQKDLCLEWYGWEIHPEWRNRKAKEKYAGERAREQFAELGKEAGINGMRRALTPCVYWNSRRSRVKPMPGSTVFTRARTRKRAT